ncbi:AAA family ATPase [Verrucosispora sp. TAA-831]|uniref:AAA family ATPase n=1 Tax=Verrucosispora sp. TAA-831 TaxID=3422227 RepID=UPI003D6F421F
MRLASIHVQGFRSLADVGPIEITRPTILVGHNDSGKTALLDAIAYLLNRYTLSEEDRTYLREPTVPTSGELSGRSARVETTTVTGEFVLSPQEQKEYGLLERVRIRRRATADGQGRFEIEAKVPEDLEFRDLTAKRNDELRDLAKAHDIDIRGITKKDDLVERISLHEKAAPSITDWVSLPDAKTTLPHLLNFGDQDSAETAIKAALNTRFQQHLDDPALKSRIDDLRDELSSRVKEDAKELVRHVEGRCRDLKSVVIEPEISFSKALRATRLNLATTDGEEVDIGRFGAGRARRVSLAIWEWASETLRSSLPRPQHLDDPPDQESLLDAQPPDAVVLYDEPDTHLDYLQQRRIMKIIQEQSDAPNIVVVLATHSMNLIDGAAVHELVHLRLNDSRRTEVDCLLSTGSHHEHDRHLMNVAISLGLRNTVLLHERFFLAVEGDTEMQSFPILFKLSTGKTLQQAGIALVACNKNEGAILFAGHLVQHGRQVAFVVDGDTIKQKFYNEGRLADAGLKLREHVHLVGKPDKELEHLFTDEQWCRAANENWPRVDEQTWTPDDIRVLREGKKFSAGLADTFRTNSESGPSGKPATMLALVQGFDEPAEVPMPIHEIFRKLLEMAALDA